MFSLFHSINICDIIYKNLSKGEKRLIQMPKVTINEERCRGCELCTTACPKHIISLAKAKLNAAGYHPAEVTDQSQCIGCAMCARMCPHVAITVEK